MVIRNAPSRPKPMAHRPAVGSASANLDRGLATQRLPMAAVALTVEAPLRRAIARVQPTAVDTGRVLRTAVAMAATAEGAPRRAIAPAPATAVALDTDQALRMAGEVPIAVAVARIMAAVVAASMVVVAEAGAADLIGDLPERQEKATRIAAIPRGLCNSCRIRKANSMIRHTGDLSSGVWLSTSAKIYSQISAKTTSFTV